MSLTKLESSVRAALKPYGQDLRARRYWTHNGEMGNQFPDGFHGYVQCAYADCSAGVCDDVTIYVVGDGLHPNHYYEKPGCICVTDAICDYIESDRSSEDYNCLVAAIADRVKRCELPPPEVPEYTGEYIPLEEYAERHGRSSSACRQRAGRGGFVTAKKFGGIWIIREDEPYGDNRYASERRRIDEQ